MAAPSTSSPGKLVLEPNVPQTIALKYPTGKECASNFSDEKQVFYSLVDGRSAYFSLGIAQKITDLQLGTREPFNICKRWNGQKTQAPRYDVWLTNEGEKARAAMEAEPPIAVPQPTHAEVEQHIASAVRQMEVRQRQSANLNPATAPPPPTADPAERRAVTGWAAILLRQTNTLIDVYAHALDHAEAQGIPAAVVRTVMISAFIGLQKKGDFGG